MKTLCLMVTICVLGAQTANASSMGEINKLSLLSLMALKKIDVKNDDKHKICYFLGEFNIKVESLSYAGVDLYLKEKKKLGKVSEQMESLATEIGDIATLSFMSGFCYRSTGFVDLVDLLSLESLKTALDKEKTALQEFRKKYFSK